ncbi:MAG: long-chain fatty acid--CoA ligase, partial [Deltaproteobacteria bacterium]
DKKNYLTALVTLNEEEIEKFLKSERISEGADIYSHPSVQKLISSIIEQKNKELASYETIKKFSILKNDFTIEAGELTPSMKLRRSFCSEKYKDIIHSMYR